MADDTATAPATAPSPLENAPVTASEAAKSADVPAEAEAPSTEAAVPAAEPEQEQAAEKPTEGRTNSSSSDHDNNKALQLLTPLAVLAPTEAEPEKPAETADVKDADTKDADAKDTEMKDAEPASAPAEGAEDAQPEAAATTATADETATPGGSKDKSRRKSTGTGGGQKNLKKKGSMARITHLNCQPGDHYFVKTKGYTKWPAIISDDEMLPLQLIKSRPVTAKREDGSYREDFADGGKRVADRTYPVMYLQTNEL